MIRITTDVFCDKCDVDWIHGLVSHGPARREARKIAKEAGWATGRDTFGRITDWCPKCHKSIDDDYKEVREHDD